MNKLFAVRDVKAEQFGQVMVVPTEGLAVRAFTEACRDPRGDLHKYPGEFMLYELGDYDQRSGEIKPLKLPRFVVSASEALAAARAADAKNQPELPIAAVAEGEARN